MIPRLIHSIWIGSSIPEQLKGFSERMASINPLFKYQLHGEELIERYSDDVYVRALLSNKEELAFVADRLRVLLLREEGGIYVDVDALPVKSFAALSHILDRQQVDFLTGMRSPFRKGVALHRGISFVDNTVLCSAKNGRMINRIARLWSPKVQVVNGYNIGLEILDNAETDTVLLGYKYFYSEVPIPEAIVLHDGMNLGSWCKDRKPPIQTTRLQTHGTPH